MLPLRGPLTSHVELAEGAVFQHIAEGAARLIEDLFAVGDEEKGVVATGLLPQTLVIERRHHGLAGAGGRHHQVAVTVVAMALHLEGFEDSLLEWASRDVEWGHVRGVVRAALRLHGQRELLGVVVVVLRVVPVAIERNAERLEHRRCVDLCKAHVPLEAVEHGRLRQVG